MALAAQMVSMARYHFPEGSKRLLIRHNAFEVTATTIHDTFEVGDTISQLLVLPCRRRLPRAYPFHLRVRDRSRLPLRQAKATRKRRTRRLRSVSLLPVSWVSLLMIYENDCRFMTKTRAACRDGDGHADRGKESITRPGGRNTV